MSPAIRKAQVIPFWENRYCHKPLHF